MPLFRLSDEIAFPPPELSEPDGLLAVGGDLSVDRLLMAYRMGIFPWYAQENPILWWSPDPRLVLFPDEFHLSRRLKRTLKQEKFTVTYDTAFESVIEGCAGERKDPGGTWILPEMSSAYVNLHRAGFAHSVEVWRQEKLVGGLYGVSLGGCFFGESMFSRVSDASKVALSSLVSFARRADFDMIDCQVTSDHLLSLGARELTRWEFLQRLGASLKKATLKGMWEAPK